MNILVVFGLTYAALLLIGVVWEAFRAAVSKHDELLRDVRKEQP